MNKPKSHFDANKAWLKLSDRLHSEGLLEVGAPVLSSRSYVSYLKVAASIVLVATTAALMFLFFGKNQPQQFVLANAVVGQTLVKTLNDGSVVYLAGNSSISFSDEYNSSNRRLKLEGEAFFEVASHSKLPFVVEMVNSSVEVIGTSFLLKSLPGQDVELVVETGKVEFKPLKDAQKGILVEKGQRLVFDGNEHRKTFSALDHRWRYNHLHFSNEKLNDILGVINKNFNVNIIIEDQTTAQRYLTVTFYDNSVEEMVSIISEYYNLKAINADDRTIVLTQK